MKARFYDLMCGGLDRAGLAERRDRLVGMLEGEVLEIGAGTGRNIPRYRTCDPGGGPRARPAICAAPGRARRRGRRARRRPRRGRARGAAVPRRLVRPRRRLDLAVFGEDLDAALAEIRRVLRPQGR